jgi:hypothetical protein
MGVNGPQANDRPPPGGEARPKGGRPSALAAPNTDHRRPQRGDAGRAQRAGGRAAATQRKPRRDPTGPNKPHRRPGRHAGCCAGR